MPVATSMNPTPMVRSPAHPTGWNRPVRSSVDGGMADTQKGTRTRKVSNSWPRALVYSPRRAIATMTRKAATTAADIPARNVPGANGSSLGKTNVDFPANTRRCILRNQSCLIADS